MVLTTVPTTALTVHAEESVSENSIDGEPDKEVPAVPSPQPVASQPEATESTEVTQSDAVVVNEVSDPTEEPDATAPTPETPTAVTVKVSAANEDSEGTFDIDYLGACVSEGTLAEDADLAFNVYPKDGYQVTAVTVKVAGSTVSPTAGSISSGKGEGYTVLNNVLVTKDSSNNTVYKPAEIIVTTTKVSYTVTFAPTGDVALATGCDIYPLEGSTASAALDSGTYAQAFATADAAAKDYAIVPKAGYIFEDVKLAGDSDVLVSKNTATTEITLANSSKANAYVFTINPAKVAELSGTTGAINAEVNVRAAYTLTIGVLAKGTAGTDPYTVAASTASDSTFAYVDTTGKFMTGDTPSVINEDEKAKFAKSLAFKVTPNTVKSYKDIEVTAKIGASSNGTSFTDETKATELTVNQGTPAANHAVDCTIPLSGITLTENTLIKIEVTADLDGTATEKVRKITINPAAGTPDALKHATITWDTTSGGSFTNEIKNGSLTTNEDAVYIKITPEAGYEFTKGTSTKSDGAEDADDGLTLANTKQVVYVREARLYKTDATGYKVTANYDREVIAHNGSDPQEIALTLADGTTGDSHWPNATGDKPYYDTAVEISVGIVPSTKANMGEKLVAFVDGLKENGKATYSFPNSTGIARDDDTATIPAGSSREDMWAVAKSVSEFTFQVTSAIKPYVSWNNGSADQGEIKALKTEGNVYTYVLPTTLLAGSGAQNKVTITKASETAKTVKVTIPSANVSDLAAYNDGNEITGKTYVSYQINGAAALTKTATENGDVLTLDGQPKLGDTVTLKFKAKTGAKFKSVSYTMGDAAPVQVSAKDVEGDAAVSQEATVEVKVTGDLNVSVATESDYAVKLSHATPDTVKEAKDGGYATDYDTTAIKVELMKAGAAASDIYDVAIKKNGKTAKTKATIDGGKAFATIAAIDESDRGSVLTIEVIRKEGKVKKTYTTTLTVSKVTDGVVVTNAANGNIVKDGAAVDVMPDSKIKFKVTSTAGGADKDLRVEIRSGKENAKPTDDTDARALIDSTPAIVNGEVEVTVKPLADAVSTPVMLSFYRNGDSEKKTLAGGGIFLNITEPLVRSDKLKSVDVKAGTPQNEGISFFASVNTKEAVAKPEKNKLYYKVEVKNINKGEMDADAKNAVLETVEPITEFVEVPLSDGKYAGSMTEFVEETLVKTYTEDGVNKKGENIVPAEIYADVTVTLVQSLKGAALTATSVAGTDYVAGAENTIFMSTKKPLYETKLTVKKENNATVYTGQTDAAWDVKNMAKIATPVFKDVSFGSVKLLFVDTKTGKILSTHSDDVQGETPGQTTEIRVSGLTKFKAKVEDGAVYVGVDSSVYVNSDTYKNMLKTLGVKIIADAPSEGYAATAVVNLKVVQGIVTVNADESKTSLPKEVYVDGKGNAKSIKITPVFNGGNKTFKPAKAALTWEISNNTGTGLAGLDAHMLSAVSGQKPQVSVKNGTISIKGYVCGKTAAENTFYVTARAADFSTNSAKTKKVFGPFVITNKNQTIADVMVLKTTDDGTNFSVVGEGSLKADDFKDGKIYVAAVDGSQKAPAVGTSGAAATIRAFTIPAAFKANGKNVTLAKSLNDNLVQVIMNKPGETKITATTVDGGKAGKVKDELKLTVAGYTNLGLAFESADGVAINPDEAAEGITYTGAQNQKYSVKLQYKLGNDWSNEAAYKNVKVSIKGGKFVEDKFWKKTGGSYVGDIVAITDKDGVATVTLKDLSDKSEKKYTIKREPNVQTKAPSIKLYESWNADGKQKKVDTSTTGIKWSVTDKTANNYAGKYVMIAPDYTAKESTDPEKLDGYSFISNWTPGQSMVIRKIDENGFFNMDSIDLDTKNGAAIKLIATVGTMENGEFVPAAKDVKLNINVGKKKWNSGLKVTTSYKLDPYGAGVTELLIDTDESYDIENVSNVIKAQKEKDTYKDHMNNFTRYFEVKSVNTLDSTDLTGLNKHALSDRTYATIGIKQNLTADVIAELFDKDVQKKDCTGWITVDNGTTRKDYKITIKIADVKLKATAPAIFEDTKSNTIPVTIWNGKNKVAVSNKKLVKLASDEKGLVDSLDVADGNVVIKTKAPIAADKYDIELDVVPDEAAYKAATAISQGAAEVGVEKILSEYSRRVKVSIDVKALDAKKILKAEGSKYALQKTLYDGTVAPTAGKIDNGYARGTNATGDYVVDVPYTWTADGAALTGKFAVNTSVGTNEFKDSKNKSYTLITPVAVQKKVDGKTVNVLQIKVNKAALAYLHSVAAADKNAKVAADWGKKSTVTIDAYYKNSTDTVATNKGTLYSTLKLDLTMPEEPKDFNWVKNEVSSDATIEKIEIGDKYGKEAMITDLKEKVERYVNSIIPADSDVELDSVTAKTTYDVSDVGGYDYEDEGKMMEKGKVVLTIKLDSVLDGGTTTASIKKNFNIGIKSSYETTSDNDAKSVLADITTTNSSALKNAVALVISESTTAAGLEKLILDTTYNDSSNDTTIRKKFLGTGKGNISVRVIDFKRTLPTKEAGLTIKAQICVRDLASGAKETTLPLSDGGALTFTKGAAQYKTITAAETAIKATDATGLAGASKANFIAIYKDAAADVDTMKKMILAKAETIVNNPNIKVSLKDDKLTLTPASAGASDAAITFTLLLEENKRVKEIDYNAVEITGSQAWTTKFGKTLAEAKAAVQEALDNGGADGSLIALKTAILAVNTAGNKANDITAIEGEVKTLVKPVIGASDLVDNTEAVFGYTWKITNMNYKMATAKTDGTVSFDIEIASKANPELPDKITVSDVKVDDPFATNMTREEVKSAVEGLTRIELSTSDLAALTSAAGKTAIEGKLDELIADDQVGEMKDIDKAVSIEGSELKTNADGTKTLTNVKITVKRTEAGDPVIIAESTHDVVFSKEVVVLHTVTIAAKNNMSTEVDLKDATDAQTVTIAPTLKKEGGSTIADLSAYTFEWSVVDGGNNAATAKGVTITGTTEGVVSVATTATVGTYTVKLKVKNASGTDDEKAGIEATAGVTITVKDTTV